MPTSTSSNFWSNLVFVVTATKTNTVLQFDEQDDNYYLGLDDVSVTPIPLPNVQNISQPAKTTFAMTWNSLPSLVYKVQYSTNLVSTNWFNLSTNTATGTTLSFTKVPSAPISPGFIASSDCHNLAYLFSRRTH